MGVYEFDSEGTRIFGYNTPISFYSPDRTLQQQIYLKSDNTLNIGGTVSGGGDTSNYLTETEANVLYLRLDCTNDPLTQDLDVISTSTYNIGTKQAVEMWVTSNVAFGHQFDAVATITGDYNTLAGYGAGASLLTGYANVGIGYQTLTASGAGSAYRNVAIGYQTFYTAISAHHNVGIGYKTFYDNESGSYNVGIGIEVLESDVDGTYNVGIGYRVLRDGTASSKRYNVGIGYYALENLETGSYNVAIGTSVLDTLVYGDNNIGIGEDALASNLYGDDNTAIGRDSTDSMYGGRYNIAVGVDTLDSMRIGWYNLAVGHYSLNAVLSSWGPIASFTDAGGGQVTVGDVGHGLNNGDTVRIYNAANYSAYNNTFTVANVAANTFEITAAFAGDTTGYWGKTDEGWYNIGMGAHSGEDITTGQRNSLFGYGTGLGITTGSSNSVFGANVTGLAGGLSNNIILADGDGVVRLQIDDTGQWTLTPDANTDLGLTFTGTTSTGVMTWMEDEDYFQFADDVLIDGTLTVLKYLHTNLSVLTLAVDAITVTNASHVVAAQAGVADDLVTINGSVQYQTVILQADSGDTITIKHGTGNIELNGEEDFELSGDKTIILFYDGTNWSDVGAGGGASGGTSNLLFSQVVDVTVANTTDETTILGAGRGSKTIPANTLDVGSVIVIVCQGHISDTATPTLDLKVKLGGTEVCSTGAETLAPTFTSEGFTLRIEIACRTTGGAGTVVAGGTFEYSAGNQHKLVKTGTTVADTTAALAVDVTADWSAAAAGNTITCQIATIELLKADELAVAAPSGLTAVEV